MLGSLRRAVDLYHNEAEWKKAVAHAMVCDFSWASSAKKYIEMYEKILAN